MVLLAILTVGCAGTRPHYGWLRKQGAVEAAHPAPPADTTTGDISTFSEALPTGNDPVLASTDEADVALAIAPRPQHLAGTVYPVAPPVTEQDTTWYAPQARPWNAKAIASLPVAVATVVIAIAVESVPILLIGGALAFVLALIGGLQCRDRLERGKGFAIAAMILATAALFAGMMASLLAL